MNWLANSPRSHITNQRALEVLRDLGVEADATAVGTPWNLMGDTLFTTSLAGEEVARMRTWGTGENRIGDYLQGSPWAPCGPSGHGRSGSPDGVTTWPTASPIPARRRCCRRSAR